jgi:hypothetical protein
MITCCRFCALLLTQPRNLDSIVISGFRYRPKGGVFNYSRERPRRGRTYQPRAEPAAGGALGLQGEKKT